MLRSSMVTNLYRSHLTSTGIITKLTSSVVMGITGSPKIKKREQVALSHLKQMGAIIAMSRKGREAAKQGLALRKG